MPTSEDYNAGARAQEVSGMVTVVVIVRKTKKSGSISDSPSSLQLAPINAPPLFTRVLLNLNTYIKDWIHALHLVHDNVLDTDAGRTLHPGVRRFSLLASARSSRLKSFPAVRRKRSTNKLHPSTTS